MLNFKSGIQQDKRDLDLLQGAITGEQQVTILGSSR